MTRLHQGHKIHPTRIFCEFQRRRAFSFAMDAVGAEMRIGPLLQEEGDDGQSIVPILLILAGIMQQGAAVHILLIDSKPVIHCRLNLGDRKLETVFADVVAAAFQRFHGAGSRWISPAFGARAFWFLLFQDGFFRHVFPSELSLFCQ